MATILSFWRMTYGSFTYSEGRISTTGLLSAKSKSFFEPMRKPATIFPRWIVFFSPVTTPFS